MAEGADPIAQQQLFNFLGLPDDLCIRQKFYSLAKQNFVSGDNVKLLCRRILVVDESLKMNQDWANFITNHSLLDVVPFQIKKYPQIAANHMRRLISAALPTLNLNGNSVLLDSIEYSGLWTTAFSDAVIERAPFYNPSGQKIGSVDLMTMKKRVRMAYIPNLKAKILELPIGENSRYRIIFCMFLNNKFRSMVNELSSLVSREIMELLEESHIPLDVAIPRFGMRSDIDVRNILEDAGISSLWTNPAATKYISEPPALPSSFAQRATITIGNSGLYSAPQVLEPPQNSSTGLHPMLGRDLIANKPFIFAVVDAETYTCLMAASYSRPTYPQ